MKIFTIVICVAVLLVGCASEPQGFIIEGKISNANGKTVYLMKGKNTVDSVKIDDEGNFAFNGQTSEPDFYYLTIPPQNTPIILIDSIDRLTVSDDAIDMFRTCKVTGSKNAEQLSQLFNKYMQGLDEFRNIEPITQEDTDTIKMLKYQQSLAIYEEQRNFLREYIKNNCTNLTALAAFGLSLNARDLMITPENDYDLYKMVDDSLMKHYPNSKNTKILRAKMIEIERAYEMAKARDAQANMGQEAPDFEVPDLNGGTVKLSDLRGKYVLLDFWASWCAPCRKENPVVVSAYNKYKSKGFEIFQVSLDRTRSLWEQAIKQDNLGQWRHGSDLKQWDCAPAKLYGVQSIPSNFLIDPNGNIIARDLRGQALDATLSKVLK